MARYIIMRASVYQASPKTLPEGCCKDCGAERQKDQRGVYRPCLECQDRRAVTRAIKNKEGTLSPTAAMTAHGKAWGTIPRPTRLAVQNKR